VGAVFNRDELGQATTKKSWLETISTQLKLLPKKTIGQMNLHMNIGL